MCSQCCGCRLAMGAADDKGLASLEKFVPQDLGEVCIGDPRLENSLKLRIAARHSIADDDQIRSWLQVPGMEPGEQRDALVLEEITHRWIDVVI